ncbi:hypothetical protein A2415_03070 [candidate division WWE3 bacterium RIFOXYC1_FULL_39_7]|nr:MAG: hypothetical protein A2415_03070 [candidate division WWE3 bacterium RIFOXYC1_FULL_39_7]
MAAAGMMDLFFVPNLHMMFETCGMGADRGWGTKTVKTINASTLSAIVLAAMGLPTTKHGSYGNTTKIGSTDVLEQSGANVAIDGAEELMRIFKKTRFLFTDAHTVKTLHYLSHLLKVETVNHVIGPMTGPVSSSTRLYKLMGVNHNVHPLTVAGAYTELHREGFVNLGGAVIVGGVNAIPKREDLHSPTWFRDHCFLDEVSPVATIVCLATGPTVLGTVCLEGSAPFGVEFHEHDLKVPNEMHTLMQANQKALRGEGPLGNYLAANTALARMAGETEFFTLDRLRDYTEDALKVLQSGAAERLLDVYVEETGGTRIVW